MSVKLNVDVLLVPHDRHICHPSVESMSIVKAVLHADRIFQLCVSCCSLNSPHTDGGGARRRLRLSSCMQSPDCLSLLLDFESA